MSCLVKRAVFIAAGTGKRLLPVTGKTPKPLVKINGVRIIDTLLDAVVSAGIEEIIIVRGYLAEQFDILKTKYPQIKFLENPYFNEANNISSLLAAENYLQNAYIIESDLFLKNPYLILKHQESSNYLGVKTEKTGDWCFKTKNGIITGFNLGGENCHHMFGISYWTEEDGAKLAECIKNACQLPGGKDFYWDEVPLKHFKNEFSVKVRECSFDDIIEIDTLEELQKLDSGYKDYV